MKKILLSCMAATCLFSCSKKEHKDNTDPTTPGKELSALEKKVLGKWQLVSSVDSNTAFNPAKVTDALQECEKDDVYTFSADKTYGRDAGATKCSYVVGEGGLWSIRTIRVDSTDVYSFEADIVSCLCYNYPLLTFIDDTKMVLRGRDNSGQVFTVNTFRKL